MMANVRFKGLGVNGLKNEFCMPTSSFSLMDKAKWRKS